MNREEIKKEILNKIEHFNDIAPTYGADFNSHANDDFDQLIKELEAKYNCEIDKVFYTIKFKD